MDITLLFLILVIGGRVFLLGYERIEFRKAGENQDPTVSTFLLFAIAGVMLLPMLVFASFEGAEGVLYALISGTVYSVAFVLYVYVLSNYDVSLVSPLYNFNVLFLFVLSIIFLSEFALNTFWFRLGGILLLFIGTSLLDIKHSLKASIKAVFSNKGCLLMIFVSLLIAIGRVIDGLFVKYTPDPFLYAIIQYWVISLYLFIFILATNKLKLIKTTILSNYKHFLLGSFANGYSYMLLLISISLFGLDISIAEPLSMLSLLVTMGLSAWILKEKIKGRVLGAILMLIGSILLVLNF